MTYSGKRATISTWGTYEDDGRSYQRWSVHGTKGERFFIATPEDMDPISVLWFIEEGLKAQDEMYPDDAWPWPSDDHNSAGTGG